MLNCKAINTKRAYHHGRLFSCAHYAKRLASAKWLFSRKVRFSLRSVTANAKFMRLLIASLQGITNALLNG